MLNNYKRHVISSPEEMIKLVEKGSPTINKTL